MDAVSVVMVGRYFGHRKSSMPVHFIHCRFLTVMQVGIQSSHAATVKYCMKEMIPLFTYSMHID
jgi:hypothetical protein